MDAAIEFRNELIVSRQNNLRRSAVRVSAAVGKSHHGLAKLQSLSLGEMRSLLGRYFDRMVDLRDLQRRLQMQRAELEVNWLTVDSDWSSELFLSILCYKTSCKASWLLQTAASIRLINGLRPEWPGFSSCGPLMEWWRVSGWNASVLWSSLSVWNIQAREKQYAWLWEVFIWCHRCSCYFCIFFVAHSIFASYHWLSLKSTWAFCPLLALLCRSWKHDTIIICWNLKPPLSSNQPTGFAMVDKAYVSVCTLHCSSEE